MESKLRRSVLPPSLRLQLVCRVFSLPPQQFSVLLHFADATHSEVAANPTLKSLEVTAIRAQYVKESASDLDRGLSWGNGKPCRIAECYFLPGKPGRKSARAATK